MRSTSPLSLLVFLQLTTAAPILLPSDCSNYLACQPQTRSSTPATHLRTPHFPPHQLRPWDSGDQPLLEEPISNIPITPPSDTSPSVALSANHPLTSAYLLSLTTPSTSALQDPPRNPLDLPSPTSKSDTEVEDEDEVEPLPAKPTSALPLLRQLDSLRYWTSLRSDPERQSYTTTASAHAHKIEVEPKNEDEAAEQILNSGPISPLSRGCEYILGAGNTAFGQPMRMARDYSDLLVVGIVLLFLGVVIVVELVQKVIDLRQAIWPRGPRRGQIYLEDDETVAFIVKKPFFLQPPPPPRYKIAKQMYQDEEVGEMGEGGFYYDSDAFQKV